MSSDPRDQPYLHDLTTAVRAPLVVVAAPDGQVRASGVQGVYAYDRRLLSVLVVTVDGRDPACLGSELDGAASARTTYVVRGSGDRLPDPTVLLYRTRVVEAERVVERLKLESRAQDPVSVRVSVHLASDLADLSWIKQGSTSPARVPDLDGAGDDGFTRVRWADDAVQAEVTAEPASTSTSATDAGVNLHWDVLLATGESQQISVTVTAEEAGTPAPFTGAAVAPWEGVAVDADDRRLAPLLHRGLDDLESLLMRDGDDVFAAAGSPWFFTLFGRDSLWTARLLLPFGTDLAMGTLRSLARRQGRVDDPATEEQPGKILHEVRRDTLRTGELTLPPVYYGTVDATPLWVTVLTEAWRWGADPRQVEALLPAAEQALRWLVRQVDDDTTGFVRYVDHTGVGLANQGWKDSGDSVQWADGRLADAPIALSEVQAYTYEAAVAGADLLDAFGRPGATELRQLAADLRTRFAARFWVEDATGRYPAIALDRAGEAVDGIASNMGHLLGTGLLDRVEAATIAQRLAGPDLDSGFGLRTLSATSARYSPLSYHGGAVWPHDTAIAARGLLLEGEHQVAADLLGGLLATADTFGFRLPELYGGFAATESMPLPYPASCRPQAWSAAAGTCVVTLGLGLQPDVPGGALGVHPPASRPWSRLTVTGLRLGDHQLSVSVDRDGSAHATTSHPGVTITSADAAPRRSAPAGVRATGAPSGAYLEVGTTGDAAP